MHCDMMVSISIIVVQLFKNFMFYIVNFNFMSYISECFRFHRFHVVLYRLVYGSTFSFFSLKFNLYFTHAYLILLSILIV